MIKSAFTLVLVALQAVTIEADWGCYSPSVNACDCSVDLCSETKCEAAGKIWAQGCNSCSCVCDTESTTYTATVDLFAGELGYFSFDECGDLNPNPTLKMIVGETYTFDQTDISNYYHPMGFAYGTDGALSENTELEPGEIGTTSTSACIETLVCPAPIYFADGVMLGSYTNLVDTAIIGSTDFGLDFYEPKFFLPIGDWSSVAYTVKLKFDDATFSNDFFYFCHIHKGMSGRIVLTDANGDLINTERLPQVDGAYHTYSSGDFDTGCGTYQLAAFQPIASNTNECPTTFVCDTSVATDTSVQEYAMCIDAMNCKMMQGMTTSALTISELFLYQMIPHHQNAVSMAKALLKKAEYNCADIEEGESTECVLERISREIINNQNFQIQTMYNLLLAEQTAYDGDVSTLIEAQDCVIAMRDVTAFPTVSPTISTTASPTVSPTTDSVDEAPCFSAVTTAFVSGKGSVTMDLIEVGDLVLTGSGEFQSVYSIDHRDMNKSTKFLQIEFGSDHDVLEVTPKHMIFEEGKVNPVASGTIDVGDRVVTPTGYETVTGIGIVERKGVFNPLTADGTIVASGMVASTFSSLLNQNDSIEISGRSIMSYQQFFTNLVKPYKFFCTTLSLELCRADSEKVMVSELASRIFFFHNNGDSQASLLSFVAFLLSIMETIVLPLVYISIPVGILKLLCAGKK